MLEARDRNKLRKRMYSPPVFALLLILAFVAVKGTWNVYWKRAESQANLNKVTEQAAALQSEQDNLTTQIARLQTTQGVEEEIRSKFSVVKPGEQVVVVVDDPAEKATSTPPKPGFFHRVWNSIAHIFGGGDKATTTETIEASSTNR